MASLIDDDAIVSKIHSNSNHDDHANNRLSTTTNDAELHSDANIANSLRQRHPANFLPEPDAVILPNGKLLNISSTTTNNSKMVPMEENTTKHQPNTHATPSQQQQHAKRLVKSSFDGDAAAENDHSYEVVGKVKVTPPSASGGGNNNNVGIASYSKTSRKVDLMNAEGDHYDVGHYDDCDGENDNAALLPPQVVIRSTTNTSKNRQRQRSGQTTPPGGGSSAALAAGLADDEHAKLVAAQPLTATSSNYDMSALKNYGVMYASASDLDESTFSIFIQILFPYIVAGFGMVGAGIVLDVVQHWPVFTDITELFVVIPALLGLKGNLEMTLASRLSTAANCGEFRGNNALRIIGANLALIQSQAVIVGFLASMFAVLLGAFKYGHISPAHTLLICGASCATASLASLLLGVIMSGVIFWCERLKINPDNIATPIAAALGDIVTLGILSILASWFYRDYHTAWWFFGPALCLTVVWVLLPMWFHISWQSDATRNALIYGWTPVVSGMLISSGAGSILEKLLSSEAKYFQGVAVFQPVINGVAGNLVAVQASRIGTFLHRYWKVPGRLPPNFRLCTSIRDVYFSHDRLLGIHSRSARVLLALVVPGHLLCTVISLSFSHPRDREKVAV